MSKSSNLIKSILNVMVANVISLLGSLACGFLLPKLFSIDDYGYYKIFTLYLVYTAMLHFGFPDGILLRHSGVLYEDLDKKKFRSITRFFAYFQLLISIFIIGLSFLFQSQYRIIVAFLGICTFSINLITYFQFLSQASLRFNEFSKVKIVTSVLTFFTIMGMYFINMFTNHQVGFVFYLVVYTLINWMVLFYYFYKYKEIIIGEKVAYRDIKYDIISYFRTGIILTISYQILQLVLNLDRQFVSVLYTTQEYAIYSFAYSLISMITTVISAISLVLFPTLKQLRQETAMSYFSTAIFGVESFVLLCLGGYYPLTQIINWFLPKYKESLVYLRILFPGLVVSSCITIIIFTYYKMLNYNVQFFVIGVITLILAVVFNYGAWKIYKTPLAISYASIIVMIMWYVMTIKYLEKRFDIKYIKNLIYMLIVGGVFYLISSITNHWFQGMILYELLFLGITVIFNKAEIKQLRAKVLEIRK